MTNDGQAGGRAGGQVARAPLPTTVAEVPVPGSVPRYEIPGWRERFGVVAGITGRGAAADGSFDLGLWTSQPVEAVMRRWRAFRNAEPGFTAFVMAHQAHGAEVAWHGAARGWTIHERLDGHLTGEAGTMLLVTVADCIPIYLVAPAARVIGLVHAGWRGTAAGILRRSLEQLTSAGGIAVADIVMHCGVGICGRCYEVGSEVMDGCGVARPGPGPWHLDLRAQLTDEALRLGVGEVSTSPWCSAHDRAAFMSHRASGGSDGRMVAYLGLRSAPGLSGVGSGPLSAGVASH
jgi:polyphenol oxidase